MGNKSARNKRKLIEAEKIKTRNKSFLRFKKGIYFYLFAMMGIILVGYFVYSNTLHSGFQYDDNGSIINNLSLRHLSNFTDISTWLSLTNGRLLSYFTFALNYQWSELDVYGYHIVNIIIHILTALIVFWVILLTFKTPVMRTEEISKYAGYIAFFGGLIFVAHPVQTNAVSYIVQRMASLSTMFYILSLCLYVKGRMIQIDGKRKVLSLIFYVGAVIGFVLGMWSKETVYTLPVALIMYEFFFIRDKENRVYWRYILSALLIIALFVLYKIISGGVPRETADISRLEYLMTQFRVLVTYIRLLFIPINQNLDYDFPLSKTLWDVATMGSLLLLIGVLLGGIYAYKKYRLLSFGIFWFFLTLSIESSIFPITDVIFEHRLYLPMFGYVLFLVCSFYYFILKKKNHQFVVISLMIIVSSYAYAAYSRNEVWKTEITFLTDIIEKSPNKPRPRYGRAKIYIDLKRYDEAIADCNMAIQLKHDCAEAYNNRGMVYALRQDLQVAKADLDSALKFNPIYPDAMVNLANVYCLMKNYDSAIVKFDRLLKLYPTAMGGFNGRGVCYLNTMKYDSAITDFNVGMSITPNNPTLWYNRGLAYARKGMPVEAINDYSKSLSLNPNAGDVLLDRAISYQNIRQPVKAWDDLQRALAIGYKVPPQMIENFKNVLPKEK